MSVSRRRFVTDASVLGLLAALLPELAAAQEAAAPQPPTEDTPHDSYDFWNGFFDSVNPYSRNYGKKSASRGPKDQLPDPGAETQYLHYRTDTKRLRYATDIGKGGVAGPRRRRGRQHCSLAVSSRPAAAKPMRMPRSFALTPPRYTPI